MAETENMDTINLILKPRLGRYLPRKIACGPMQSAYSVRTLRSGWSLGCANGVQLV